MENIKAGENRMVPDIRPENIETITESYTPSGGGEQTTTYKILNVHPIINGILDKLAFFRTHAAAVWYNKLAGRTVADEIGDLKAKTEKEVIISSRFLTTKDYAVNDAFEEIPAFPAPNVGYITIQCFVPNQGKIFTSYIDGSGRLRAGERVESGLSVYITGCYISA